MEMITKNKSSRHIPNSVVSHKIHNKIKQQQTEKSKIFEKNKHSPIF